MNEEERIEPVEIEMPPFLYFVPSTFSYVRTDNTTNVFVHRDGAELYVERFTFQRAPPPPDVLTVLRDRLGDDDVGRAAEHWIGLHVLLGPGQGRFRQALLLRALWLPRPRPDGAHPLFVLSSSKCFYRTGDRFLLSPDPPVCAIDQVHHRFA